MEIEFDPDKSAKNDKERGLPFERAAKLEWDRALAYADERRDYGEQRIRRLGSDAGAALRGLLRHAQPGSPDHQFPQGQQARGANL